MRFPKHFPHFLTLTSATAWELLLLYNMTWLRSYYIESRRVYFSLLKASPFTAGRRSDSGRNSRLLVQVFALSPLRPLRSPSGDCSPCPLRSLQRTPPEEIGPRYWITRPVSGSRLPPKSKGSFSVLLAISVGVGVILGEGRGEKALLFLEGFLPGFIVFMIILGGLAVSC